MFVGDVHWVLNNVGKVVKAPCWICWLQFRDERTGIYNIKGGHHMYTVYNMMIVVLSLGYLSGESSCQLE